MAAFVASLLFSAGPFLLFSFVHYYLLIWIRNNYGPIVNLAAGIYIRPKLPVLVYVKLYTSPPTLATNTNNTNNTTNTHFSCCRGSL